MAVRNIYDDYGPIIVGLVTGSIAHFGRLIVEGRAFSIRLVIGYLMQLGLVGLAASASTRQLNISDNDFRALAAALMALSTNEVVQFLKRRTWRPLADAILGYFGYDRKQQ